jgi:hypothetical protein
MKNQPNPTTEASASGQLTGFKGEPGKLIKTSHTISTTPSQRVQRGTNRPSGKTKKKSNRHVSKSEASKLIDPFKIGWNWRPSGSVAGPQKPVPSNTSISATNSAIGSSFLRTKISVASARHTAAKATLSAILYPA